MYFAAFRASFSFCFVCSALDSKCACRASAANAFCSSYMRISSGEMTVSVDLQQFHRLRTLFGRGAFGGRILCNAVSVVKMDASSWFSSLLCSNLIEACNSIAFLPCPSPGGQEYAGSTKAASKIVPPVAGAAGTDVGGIVVSGAAAVKGSSWRFSSPC